MLIDFTVENYRSIDERVTLSAIASPSRKVAASDHRRRHTKSDAEIAEPFDVPGRGFSILPVLGIFGANASGKSNVLHALGDLFHFMITGEGFFEPTPEGHMISPFRLGDGNSQRPTCFRLSALIDGSVYTYYLAVGSSRIEHERLECMPSPPMQNRIMFDRQWNSETQEYAWYNGPSFRGSHTRLKRGLGERSAFFNLAAFDVKVGSLQSLAAWISHQMVFGLRKANAAYAAALNTMYKRPEVRDMIVEFLRQCDTGIADVEIEHDPAGTGLRAIACHEVNGTTIRWPVAEESAGTQRLLAHAASMLVSLSMGGLLLWDELEKDLHPHISRAIVQRFQSSVPNANRAQLIFTSHDYMLQSGQLLRRDQIWYTNKRTDHTTELYCLSDFKERSDRNIARGYIEGRYGAVPTLPADV